MQIYKYPVIRFPFHHWSRHSVPHHDALAIDTKFMELFIKFTKYVTPFFENAGLVVTDEFTIRTHPINEVPIYQGDCLKKMTSKSKMIIVPMTPLFGTNSFCVESSPRLGDFNIVNANIGQFIVHDCELHIEDKFINHTGFTSDSIIFGFNRP